MGKKRVLWRLTPVALLFFCLQVNANQSEKIYKFDIPEQSLVKSLATLSETTELLSLFPFQLIKAKINRPLVGFYTAQQALDILLRDTGLQAVILNDDTYMLKPKEISIEKMTQNIESLVMEEPTQNSDLPGEEDKVEVIQVFGSLRRSFEGAIGIKRSSDTVVDAITTEDIGQFSDDSIVGAIQRIPGVQVETDDSGTQGDRVSIRGLGPEFVNATINERRLLSAGTEATSLRQMNFNIFPANILSGVNVTKGQTASRPESGLAGQVDLQTMRPLEIHLLNNDSTFMSVSLEGRYQDLSKKGGYQIDVIGGLRNENKTLGSYFAFVYGENKNARDQLRVNSADTTINLDTTGNGLSDSSIVAFAPWAITYNPIREEPQRIAIATGLQFMPNEDLNINWDLLYSSYENNSERQSRQILIANTYVDAVFDNTDLSNPAFLTNENNVVKRIDYAQSTGLGKIWDTVKGFRYDNKTENLISGLNIDYFFDNNLNLNFDAYYSSVDYSQDLRVTNVRKDVSRDGFIYDATSHIPSVSITDSNELEGYNYWRSTLRPILLTGNNFGATVALNYLLDNPLLINSIDFGVHYDVTDIAVRATDFYHLIPESTEQYAQLTSATLPGTLIAQDFLADQHYSPARWFYSDYAAAVDVEPRIATISIEDIGVSPTNSYDITEDVFYIYGQINFETELFQFPFKGNIGVKADYAKQIADAHELINGVATPIQTQGDYWKYLPSLNLKLDLQQDLIVRFGISKTLTRPEYEQMAPTNSVVSTVDEGSVGEVTLGNPNLAPITSINTDLTLEWYNELDGAFVVSVFSKYVHDFVLEQTFSGVEIPNYDGLYNTTTYVNYSDGSVQGFEVTFYQPFDTITPALKGFGMSANYTYVDSEFDKDVGDAGFGFPGSSRDNFNFIAFYDEELYSIRLAYVYRSEFFRQLAGTGAQTDSAIFTESQEKLDLSMLFRANKNLSVRFTASNLSGQDRRDFVGVKSTFLEYYARGRSFSLTATYSF